MESHYLLPGTLLDERYKIEGVLGEGGFGITYAGVNVRIGLKVAVKELFWRGHVERRTAETTKITVTHAEDQPAFDEQKEKFMREARTIRDFDQEPGVVRILDYFEANDTAYMVMEYLEGETLAHCIRENGALRAEALLRRMLPLLESLSRVHAAGVIHRDISPDNIMVLPDGCFKLLDFGAARTYRTVSEGQFTTIAKDSYAPPEQYDKNGLQGPWTDIYALCATLYTCIVGTPPDSAVQRMFLDELKKPSECGAEIEPKYEEIIMRGLRLNASERFASMQDLIGAAQAALPAEHPEPKAKRSVWIACIAGLLCVCAVLGFFVYKRYDETHKFRNIVTETFRITPSESMTAKDFAETKELLEQSVIEFAGEDNYILEADSGAVTVTLPLEMFENRDIPTILLEELLEPVRDRPILYDYEVHATWEDPAASLTPGKNQITPQSFREETVVIVYTLSSESLTPGERSHAITDLKVRLDALDTPYAFGRAYGNDNKFAVRIPYAHMSRFVLHSLGASTLKLIGEPQTYNDVSLWHSAYSEAGVVEILEDGAGRFGLRCIAANSDDLRDMTQALLDSGYTRLYLAADSTATTNRFIAAELELTEPLADGTADFWDFRFEELTEIDADSRYLLDYVEAVLDGTNLSFGITCRPEHISSLDKSGKMLFGTGGNEFGLHELPADNEVQAKQLAEQISAETGLEAYYDDGLKIVLDLPVNDDLAENGIKAVRELTERYDLAGLNVHILFFLADERTDERARIIYRDDFDYETKRFVREASSLWYGGRVEAYLDELKAAWAEFPFEALGLTQDDFGG